jgi:hypothetical protein
VDQRLERRSFAVREDEELNRGSSVMWVFPQADRLRRSETLPSKVKDSFTE